MGDKRRSDYINLGAVYGAPRPDFGLPRRNPVRGPVFVSHEEQLRRDLEIINARTVAELGPLPPGGLPARPKRMSEAAGPLLPASSNQEYGEDKAMKWNQVAAVAAMATGMAACGPSPETSAIEQPLATTQTASQASSLAPEAQVTQKTAVPESATISTSAAAAIPEEIRAFVPSHSTLLAYKRFDLTGDGNEDAVLIVRHPVTEKYRDFSRNPCDLIVLHGEANGFEVVAKSSKIVDCTYKIYAREIASKADELNDMLELKQNEITSNEETDKPTGVSTTYSFKYSSKKKDWHLSYARAAFVRGKFNGEEDEELDEEKWELVVYTQIVNYPKDIPFISLSRFDPDDEMLLRAMVKNQKEI